MTHSIRERWLIASAVIMALLLTVVMTVILSDTPVATLDFDRITPVQADHAANLPER